MNETAEKIRAGKTYLGIELGSTRIKAVLTDDGYAPIASGSHEWENQLVDGVWTYALTDVWAGLQSCYADLAADVEKKFGAPLETVGAIGISAMMHGYLVFDENEKQLVPFRTWRNTMTERAAEELSELFDFNIPQRWSIAHLYQAILNKESHIGDIRFMTTLSAYIHWKLTGRKVVGVGEASGIFPVDSETIDYDARMAALFDNVVAGSDLKLSLTELLPEVLDAGDDAGSLTEAGAKLLDPSGKLKAGTPLCPPEGDAGTGMVATNSVAQRTGNISAGTSVFAMLVLEKPLTQKYMEIDMITTPSGKPVAMVHCNSFTSDLNAWTGMFRELITLFGVKATTDEFFKVVFETAMKSEPDAGGVVTYNYYSGEPITGIDGGRPLAARMPDSKLTLGNFMRALIFGAMGTLKLGMEILEKEDVQLDKLLGHGGFFKTKGVGQNLMASALGVPVSVMESAGEGGAWGIALLAAYRAEKAAGETLESYLEGKVFKGAAGSTVEPEAGDAAGFAEFMKLYTAGLEMERAAVASMK